ncbi:MAG TPA: peptidylprolyl isomerase [Blastocatellia bacterium]|nr:peptidylprolyl isomerase [Blastocatellia bacterium]
MKLSIKVIAMMLLLGMLASGLLFVQCSSSSPKTVKLTAQDMQLIFQELVPPQQQQQIASDPEEKKKLVADIKKLLAVAQVAEQEGYAEHAELKTQLSFQLDRALNDAYRKKNPDAKVGDEEINAYYATNPKDFDDFLQSNPRAAQQAQGPQREELKKQLGEFKVIAQRARKDGLDRDDLTRLQILLTRSQALAGAYLGDLQKNADKLVADADVEQYYKDHPADFDEIRVRHILISTQPKPDSEEESDPKDAKDGKAKDAKDAKAKKPADKPKTLTKDEALKKSQELLERARKGEDFAKLATENSDDQGSKDKGGEYDFFAHGKMVPEFEKAAFALQPGQISEPVETQFGYHIIKLEERRAAAAPTADEKVRQQIVEKLKQEKIEARIEEITASSDVVVPEDFDTTPKVGQPQTSSAMPANRAGTAQDS